MTMKLFSDTMKLFFRDETNLGHNETYTASFLVKEKERKLQYRWYHNFRSYEVEVRGIVCIFAGGEN